MAENRSLVVALAVIVVLGAGALVVTTGDSWAVRAILTLVALDIAVRLVRTARTGR